MTGLDRLRELAAVAAISGDAGACVRLWGSIWAIERVEAVLRAINTRLDRLALRRDFAIEQKTERRHHA